MVHPFVIINQLSYHLILLKIVYDHFFTDTLTISLLSHYHIPIPTASTITATTNSTRLLGFQWNEWSRRRGRCTTPPPTYRIRILWSNPKQSIKHVYQCRYLCVCVSDYYLNYFISNNLRYAILL